ncbi:MAG: RluA family pseudouridine synthase [Prevotellaceae bacterium]|nr:RluA family pseudouridine synthase [Prevotellaceae bacterium]
MEILYEDNHIIVVNKQPSQIVQGDKTGDEPLSELLKTYIKQRDAKLGNVFLGVTHRLDRPVSGVTVFAKTSKALTRMNELFRDGGITKFYWVIVKQLPPKKEGTLVHYLVRNEKQNKSFAYDKPVKDSKEAHLHYSVISKSDNYSLIEVQLFTGRHHQIRCQLSKIGSPIKGDLKYGADRSNPDGSISLHARSIEFIHPIKKERIKIIAPTPNDTLWRYFESQQ